ncbi:GNAT family N-acetyltransferase [Bowmanella pacifica]|uniref:N-acetyltransferase n=1 Tax=Bowmanella pacifica TaxID=502051 RepID=A0A918DI59_9ALTE|nr:GNAT family N-acetyltransferase [Bowmanella pacifica]GGO68371.1 N-acetyltransferase [Bowmanella pacifica]
MVNICHISPSHWPDILRIQDAVYHDVEPESLTVLKSKWQASPDTCLVGLDKHNQVVGYLLSHPWPVGKLPKLHHAVESVNTDNLYLHDLAVCPSARGEGVAAKLLAHLQQKSQSGGFNSISLVAVQNADGFWQKQGFSQHTKAQLCDSYGDNAQPMLKHLN